VSELFQHYLFLGSGCILSSLMNISGIIKRVIGFVAGIGWIQNVLEDLFGKAAKSIVILSFEIRSQPWQIVSR
jgi:hypothetical protein